MKDIGLSLAMSRASNLPPPKIEIESLSVTENGIYTAEEGKAFNPVDVNVQSGAQLNIAYGQTAPEDTSKIWIKADEPESLDIKQTNRHIKDFSIETICAVTHQNGMSDQLGDCVASNGSDIIIGSRYGVYLYRFYSLNPVSKSLSQIWQSNGGSKSSRPSTITYNTSDGYYYFITNNDNFSSGSNNGLYKINSSGQFTTVKSQLATESRPYFYDSIIVDNIFYTTAQIKQGNTIWYYNLLTNAYGYITEPSDITIDPSLFPSMVATSEYLYLIDMKNKKICKYSIETKSYSYLSLSGDVPSNDSGCYGSIYLESDGYAYLFGGKEIVDGISQYKSTMYKVDIVTGYVTLLDGNLTEAVASPSCALYGDSIYLCGGYKGSYNTYSNVVYKASIGFDLQTSKGELYQLSGDNIPKAYLLNSNGIKQEVNSLLYYYGDDNGKAVKAPVYYHNGTDWVEFT